MNGVGFAYTRMDCKSKCIGAIDAIESYPHLRQVDLSGNVIEDVRPLQGLRYAMTLILKNNRISTIKPWQGQVFPYLLELDLSNNALPNLPALTMKVLRKANFANNKIITCEDFGGHNTLEELNISGNSIGSLDGITITPALRKLNASKNELAGITGLVNAPALRDLDLSENKFEEMVGPWQDMLDLETIRISGCQLGSAHTLGVLGQLKKLQVVDVARNPFTEADDAGNPRVEVLVVNSGVKSIDGEEVTPEDLEEAEAERQRRVEAELERKRQEAEEEAARRQAEEEAPDGDGEGDD